MSHLTNLSNCVKLAVVVLGIWISFVLSGDVKGNNAFDDDPDIDPYSVREEGCPIVSERDKLNISKLSGNWTLPYASLNWLADIGMSLYNRSVKMSQITSICPKIVLNHLPLREKKNAHWSIKFICPKLKGEFELWCWYQNVKTRSKFICWNDKEARDMYLMIAATNQRDWLVIVRCSPKEDGRPAEGMSWALLSKKVVIKKDVSGVLFGLLEGYGFDIDEFKTQLLYDSCPPPPPR